MEWQRSVRVMALGVVLVGCGEEAAPPVPDNGFVATGSDIPPIAAPNPSASPSASPSEETQGGLEPTSLSDNPDLSVPNWLDLGLTNAQLTGDIGEVEDGEWTTDGSRGVGWNPSFATFLIDAQTGDQHAQVGFDLHAANLLHVLRPNSYVRISRNDYEVILGGDRNSDEVPADLGTVSIDVFARAGLDLTMTPEMEEASAVQLWVRDGQREHEMVAEFDVALAGGKSLRASFKFFPAQCTWGVQP